ncbi:MAG: alpha/beta hydrolase [Burkholderiaceae bacterium]
MTPFYFGAVDRQLFGLFQGAGSSAPKAVLLCNPYGQEAIRTHRMYRVLADRLVRAGYDVLRFDYFATGDSAGDDAAGELAQWTEDIARAHAELLRRSSADQVTWVGVRLGATLAIKASAAAARPPDQLVLWEPIVDGMQYLHELSERFVQTLETSYDVPNPPWRAMMARGGFDLPREGVGFEVGERLRQQLGELTPASLPRPVAARCDVIEREPRPDVDALVQVWKRGGLTLTEARVAHDFDWLAAEALSTALVPAQVVQALIERITGRR